MRINFVTGESKDVHAEGTAHITAVCAGVGKVAIMRNGRYRERNLQSGLLRKSFRPVAQMIH